MWDFCSQVYYLIKYEKDTHICTHAFLQVVLNINTGATYTTHRQTNGHAIGDKDTQTQLHQ